MVVQRFVDWINFLVLLFSSLNSVCATRPKWRSKLGNPSMRSGSQYKTCVLFSSVSRHYVQVQSSFVKSKLHTVVRSGQQTKISCIKSSFNEYLMISSQMFRYARQINNQMFTCKTGKTSGCVREELDLEAKMFEVLKWVVFYFSRRSRSEGLDMYFKLGTEKDSLLCRGIS